MRWLHKLDDRPAPRFQPDRWLIFIAHRPQCHSVIAADVQYPDIASPRLNLTARVEPAVSISVECRMMLRHSRVMLNLLPG